MFPWLLIISVNDLCANVASKCFVAVAVTCPLARHRQNDIDRIVFLVPSRVSHDRFVQIFQVAEVTPSTLTDDCLLYGFFFVRLFAQWMSSEPFECCMDERIVSHDEHRKWLWSNNLHSHTHTHAITQTQWANGFFLSNRCTMSEFVYVESTVFLFRVMA